MKSSEIRVGFVVVLALALATAGYFFLRGVGAGGDVYYLRLNGAANIAQGNDVRLQGVKIGQVQDVTLDDNQKPLLTLAIARHNPPFKLLKGYQYSVRSGSLIGENYVDIRGPQTVNRTIAYAPETVISGTTAGGVADITDQVATLGKDFQGTLQKLNVTLDRVNKGVLSYQNQIKLTQTLDGIAKLTKTAQQGFGPQGIKVALGDPTSQNSLNTALRNAGTASQDAVAAARNIKLLTQGLGSTLNENRAGLRGLLGNLNSAANNVAGLTQTLNFAFAQGGFKENSTLAFRSLRRAAENIEVGTSGIRALGSDPTTQQSLKTTLLALQQATESLRDTAVSIKGVVSDPAAQASLKTTLATLQATTENLRLTTEGFAKVIGDPQVQEDFRAIPAELRGTLTATRGTAERLNSLLGGKKTRVKPSATPGAPSTTEVAPQANGVVPSGVSFTYRRFLDPKKGSNSDTSGRNYGDLDFNSEFFGGPFRLGVANIGEGTDLTAQTGSFLGKNGDVRYGLYRSKLGLGADYRLAPRLRLEGNVWDFNRRSVNAYLGFQVTPQLEVLAGRENVRGVRTNSLGVRLSR